MLGLPLRWVAGGPLAGTLLQVLAAGPPAGRGTARWPADPYEAFALALCSRAGISDDRAAAGGTSAGSLSEALRELAAAGPADDWNAVMGLGRLTDGCAPLSSAHRPPGPPEAAALRAVALALADGATVRDPAKPPCQGTDAPGVLRSVAATVTLVENREKGEATAGESIILALV